ncbi:MAG TPA: PAS domain-containing sensor histidine kinase [Cyclobacteriaceae bacterium]|nr:PAS domain-containing sensor histidine kinase [Cyclobacteriaceae bacterium]
MTLLDQTEVGVWQDLFTSIIEDADSNILLLDDEFRIVTINPGFYWTFLETYGIELKKGTYIFQSMNETNPALMRQWKDRLQTAMGGSPVKVEDEFEIDGKQYYWELHYKSETFADGRQFVSVFSRDVSVRKAYQKRLIGNEANLRSILNTIENSIWLLSSDFELIDFNKEFFKLYKLIFGIKLVRGKSIFDFIPEHMPEMGEVWRTRYEAGLKGRPGKYIETYTIGNAQRMFEIKTYPIVEDGKVTGLTIYSRDITLQRESEDLLKAQNVELTKINSELDQFVYSASHDLKAPLMSVKGLVNMIKIDPEKANLDHYLHLIEESIHRLDYFIHDIITHSRNSRMDIMSSRIDFEKVVRESIDSLKYMQDADLVRSIINITEETPFYSDHHRLLIIFNNIISNAVRYQDKSKESFIKIDVSTTNDKTLIQFTDNGVGIAEEFKENIFKMFFRASTESKGSGLGLYIVKGTVEKLNGRISVQSKLGEGTQFTIEIPNSFPACSLN